MIQYMREMIGEVCHSKSGDLEINVLKGKKN